MIAAADGDRLRAMRAAADAALRFVEPGALIGIGTGRTTEAFIDALVASDVRPRGAVASSVRTADRLREAGIEVVPLWGAGLLPLYVDGADVADRQLRLIKGGGGAHAGERLVADASQVFVCIVDDSKLAPSLRGATVPVEVAPAEVVPAEEALRALGGTPVLREGFTTDSGNLVYDVTGLALSDPLAMELALDDVPGMVASGIFASRPADVLIVGHPDGRYDEYRRD
jgi:ribose 5-phosphate isomerase A